MLAYICSRYNSPSIDDRRRNLREHDALCGWALAHGYTPVSPFAGVDRDNPPDDADGGREAALARSQELAAWVGRAGGWLIVPDWYAWTAGMEADEKAWSDASGGVYQGPMRVVSAEEVFHE